jgi:hypothetical protein
MPKKNFIAARKKGTRSKRIKNKKRINYYGDATLLTTELKRVLKEDAGLELNVSKTSILPKGITQKSVFDVTNSILPVIPSLTQFRGGLHRSF